MAQKTIYGGSYNLLAHALPQYGISASFVNAHDLEEIEQAIRPNTRAIYLETLGNPNSDIPDIDAVAEQGIKQNTIRLSIGTEHIDDIIADLQQAFEKVAE